MSTVTSATSSTIVAILDTIGGTARMVSNAVNSASSAVDMADAYVRDARIKQANSIFADQQTHLRKVIIEAADSAVSAEKALQKKYENDLQGQKSLNEMILKLETAFAERDKQV